MNDINRYNVSWSTPSSDATGSMPLGNGDIGLNVWTETSGDVCLYLAKTDAWSEAGRLLKIGALRVSMTPPLQGQNNFQQVLRLQSGDIEIRAEDVVVRVWVDAHAPVVRMEIESGAPRAVTAAWEIWRAEERVLEGRETHCYAGSSALRESADHLWYSGARVLLCHRNEHSIWRETLELQSLRADGQDDPLLHHTFGAALEGEDFEPQGASTQGASTLVCAPKTSSRLSIHVIAAQTDSIAEWEILLDEQIARTASTPFGEARHAHEEWWRAFWERSYIHLSGTPEADEVSRAYNLQRFVTACAGRGAFPIKFNGSLFNVPMTPDEGWGETQVYNPDYRRWGGSYWWQNTRLIYWSLLASGDWEMARPLFEMYRRAWPLAKERAEKYFGCEGACFPETMTFWGTFNNDDYGLNREGKAVGEIENTYVARYWHSGLEFSFFALEYFAHTGDETFLREYLPLIEDVLDFYFTRYAVQDGRLKIHPAQTLEMWHDVTDPAPDIAGLHAILDALLRLPEEYLCERRDKWQARQILVPELPMEERDGASVLAPAREYSGERQNAENVELYAVFPYRLFGLERATLELARETFAKRRIQATGGWFQDAIQAALLGLSDEAARDVTKNFATPFAGARFPAFWGPNADWVPDQDHGNVAAMALQSMLLQSCDGKVLLFPAWPREWDAHFKLHVPGAVVEAQWRDGALQEWSTEPRTRDLDVVEFGSRTR